MDNYGAGGNATKYTDDDFNRALGNYDNSTNDTYNHNNNMQ